MKIVSAHEIRVFYVRNTHWLLLGWKRILLDGNRDESTSQSINLENRVSLSVTFFRFLLDCARMSTKINVQFSRFLYFHPSHQRIFLVQSSSLSSQPYNIILMTCYKKQGRLSKCMHIISCFEMTQRRLR